MRYAMPAWASPIAGARKGVKRLGVQAPLQYRVARDRLELGVVWYAFYAIRVCSLWDKRKHLQYRVARDRLELGVVHAVHQHELQRHVRHEALRVHVPARELAAVYANVRGSVCSLERA